MTSSPPAYAENSFGGQAGPSPCCRQAGKVERGEFNPPFVVGVPGHAPFFSWRRAGLARRSCLSEGGG